MNESDADKIEYDFETKTGTVVFAEGHQFDVADVTAYFEEASDGKVMVIRIFSGEKLAEELRFNAQT